MTTGRDRARPVRLRAHREPWWRAPGEVQLGLQPGRPVVLQGLAAGEIVLLHRLAAGWSGTGAVLAGALGLDVTRVELLLDLLDQEGVLDAAPVTESRGTRTPSRRRCVAVQGRGGLLDQVTGALLDLPARPTVLWGQQTRQREADLAAAGSPRAAGQGPVAVPDLVVVLALDVLLTTDTGVWERAGVRMLPVLTHGDTACVGPVLGGPGPCALCLDLLRAEQDPHWPLVRDQVLATRLASAVPPAVDLPAPLARHTAALAASVSALVLAGDDEVTGYGWEVDTSWPALVHRRWSRYPGCPACATPLLERRLG